MRAGAGRNTKRSFRNRLFRTSRVVALSSPPNLGRTNRQLADHHSVSAKVNSDNTKVHHACSHTHPTLEDNTIQDTALRAAMSGDSLAGRSPHQLIHRVRTLLWQLKRDEYLKGLTPGMDVVRMGSQANAYFVAKELHCCLQQAVHDVVTRPAHSVPRQACEGWLTELKEVETALRNLTVDDPVSGDDPMWSALYCRHSKTVAMLSKLILKVLDRLLPY